MTSRLWPNNPANLKKEKCKRNGECEGGGEWTVYNNEIDETNKSEMIKSGGSEKENTNSNKTSRRNDNNKVRCPCCGLGTHRQVTRKLWHGMACQMIILLWRKVLY
jgi:hypothetical protein